MEIQRAKDIVTILANGANPITGEAFDDDSHYNHPAVKRALFTLLEQVNTPKKTKTVKLTADERHQKNLDSGKPRNAGFPWNDNERVEVGVLFKSGKSTEDLSQHFERTKGAIISALEHQGIIVREDA